MQLDMGDFFAQILPIYLVCFIIPFGTLMIYFIAVRPYLRRNNILKPQKKPAITPKTVAPSTSGSIDALAQLRSARVERDPVPESDLPDLDLLMQEIESAPKPVPAAKPTAAPIRDGVYQVTLNTGQRRHAHEEIVILRDEADGRLIVQMADTAYRSLKNEPTSRKHFTTLMKELSQVVMSEDDLAPVPDVAESSASLQVDSVSLGSLIQPSTTPTTKTADDTPQTPPTERQSTPPPPRYDGVMPGDLPGYKFDDNPATYEKRRFTNPKVQFDAPPIVNIADAIEAYLQHKISYSPEFQHRNIHIHSAPGGGVRIQVDNNYYDAVDDVTDRRTRTFIQEAIAEWQERQ